MPKSFPLQHRKRCRRWRQNPGLGIHRSTLGLEVGLEPGNTQRRWSTGTWPPMLIRIRLRYPYVCKSDQVCGFQTWTILFYFPYHLWCLCLLKNPTVVTQTTHWCRQTFRYHTCPYKDTMDTIQNGLMVVYLNTRTYSYQDPHDDMHCPYFYHPIACFLFRDVPCFQPFFLQSSTLKVGSKSSSAQMTAGWWFQTFGLFSISYMGCHPSHWLSHFSRWLKHVKTTNQTESWFFSTRWSTSDKLPADLRKWWGSQGQRE